MANYVANTFQAQTPIGQAMQSIAQSMFQARLLKQKQDLQQQEMAMKQAEFDAKMPLFEAQTAAANAGAAAHYATADEKAAEMAAMKARPDTVASAFANLTRPQLGQVRGFQQSGSWGEAPKIAGLDNLGSGGDWMPTFANPQTMQKVNQADVLTGMASGPQQADNIAKAITQMMLNSQMGSGDMQGLNAASAALKGQLRGNPTANGLYQNQDVGGGLVGNDMNNPLVKSEVNAEGALAAERRATGALRGEQINTEKAQQGKYNAEAQNERNGGRTKTSSSGGKPLTAAQQAAIAKKDQEIVTARERIKAYKDGGGMLSEKASDPEFKKVAALAMQKMQGRDDATHEDWVNYLAGGQYANKDWKPSAGQKPAAASSSASVPPPAQRVKGQTYNTPKGPMIWTGTGWVPGA